MVPPFPDRGGFRLESPLGKEIGRRRGFFACAGRQGWGTDAERMIAVWNSHRELILNLVGRELKSRYKGSFIGFAWSVISPLFLAIVYVVFMTKLVARGFATPEVIIIGVFAWQFTAMCMNSGMLCITGNANLVKKVRFPREAIPLAVVLSGLVDYILMIAMELVILGGMILISGRSLDLSWFWILPLALVLHFAFNLAIALFLSAMNVYFRDTQHLVGVGMTAYFFMCPAMYGVDLIVRMIGTGPVYWLYMLNPMAGICTLYRWAFLGRDALDVKGDGGEVIMTGGQLLSHPATVMGSLLPVVLVVGALFVFRRMQGNFADYV